MNNQGSKIAQKENEKSPENKFKDMKICAINDRDLKIAVLNILHEMQNNNNNTDRQFNELRKQINEQNKYFTKEGG